MKGIASRENVASSQGTHSPFTFFRRATVFTIVSALIAFGVSSPRVAFSLSRFFALQFPGFVPGEVAYITFVVQTFLYGLGLILIVLAVIRVERPASVRELFRLGPVDWPGLGLLFLFLGILNVAEALFLRRMVYDPVRSLFRSLGITATASDIAIRPDPHLIVLNLVLLLLIVWVEAPEEIFFRGYLQNHFQERIGAGAALVVSAVVWDAWHLHDPAGFVRRLLFGIALGLVFRIRQNTTPLALGHPIANRLLMAWLVVAPLFGRR